VLLRSAACPKFKEGKGGCQLKFSVTVNDDAFYLNVSLTFT
jgi:hypothetical protein